jgi:rhodanese-related sulfurtransferase/biotin operon repressor
VGEQSLWHGGATSNPLDPAIAAGHYSIKTLNDITMAQSMSSEGPKQALFAQFALVAKAAGHPLRLELLEQLAQGDRSVEVLADRTRVSLANASQHLQHLRRAGLVTARREGKFVFYRLAEDSVLDFLASLRHVAERHLAEADRVVRDYFGRRDSLEPISRRELLDRLKAGLTTVLDVRPEDEFALGHLQGAVNIPLGKLKKRLAELDPDKDIVAYCRGPYCVLSYEAVATLRSHGFNVRRLEDGFPEWRAAGLPVETGLGS